MREVRDATQTFATERNKYRCAAGKLLQPRGKQISSHSVYCIYCKCIIYINIDACKKCDVGLRAAPAERRPTVMSK